MNTKHPLTEYRERLRITQAEFGRRVGVSRWMVNMLESGKRVPSAHLLARIEIETDREVLPSHFVPGANVGGAS